VTIALPVDLEHQPVHSEHTGRGVCLTDLSLPRASVVLPRPSGESD